MKSQFEINKEIEQLIKKKDTLNEKYSKKDIDFLQQYSGSGGQKKAIGKGVLNEFYTPGWLCEKMQQLAVHYGYTNGTILEPSIATGRIIKPFGDKSKITGFEINHFTKRICEITYPKATIHEGYFETAFLQQPRFTTLLPQKKLTWLKGYPFSLVIGNPPYGVYKNRYSSYFKSLKFKQIEFFFIYQSLRLLKKGGLLIFLTAQNFLSGGGYDYEKTKIGTICELIDAYRLPSVFKFSKVPTDIIILKKK